MVQAMQIVDPPAESVRRPAYRVDSVLGIRSRSRDLVGDARCQLVETLLEQALETRLPVDAIGS